MEITSKIPHRFHGQSQPYFGTPGHIKLDFSRQLGKLILKVHLASLLLPSWTKSAMSSRKRSKLFSTFFAHKSTSRDGAAYNDTSCNGTAYNDTANDGTYQLLHGLQWHMAPTPTPSMQQSHIQLLLSAFPFYSSTIMILQWIFAWADRFCSGLS